MPIIQRLPLRDAGLRQQKCEKKKDVRGSCFQIHLVSFLLRRPEVRRMAAERPQSDRADVAQRG